MPASFAGWRTPEAWALAQYCAGAPALIRALARVRSEYEGLELLRETAQEALLPELRELWHQHFGIERSVRTTVLHDVARWYVLTFWDKADVDGGPGRLDLLDHAEVSALAVALWDDGDQEDDDLDQYLDGELEDPS